MMYHKKSRVAVNGYGVIGKRRATAVQAQSDMELVEVKSAGVGLLCPGFYTTVVLESHSMECV